MVWLNDFRWKPSLIPWCEILQVLEGDIVHFPAPKNLMSQNIVLDKDTLFFPTSDAPLALIKGGTIHRINTEMMEVRWRTFQSTNCETAKHHGSLVTEQNFASWRL